MALPKMELSNPTSNRLAIVGATLIAAFGWGAARADESSASHSAPKHHAHAYNLHYSKGGRIYNLYHWGAASKSIVEQYCRKGDLISREWSEDSYYALNLPGPDTTIINRQASVCKDGKLEPKEGRDIPTYTFDWEG